MPGSRVPLPARVVPPLTVYVNGVPQVEGEDYVVHDGGLEFPRTLRRDHISGWRWLLGAWGVGTYRQDDSVDVRWEADGRVGFVERLDIVPLGD